MDIHPMGALMRSFVVDWLDRADPTVPPQIMAPEYAIDIAGVQMPGRDAYLEATTGQLARFPGLTVTVHDALYTTDGRAALRFTEHGASARGGAAAWRGIGIFRAEHGVLVHNATEEDYLGRRRQLLGGTPDPVDPPMVAPWTEPPADPDDDAGKAVRAWLDAGAPTRPGITYDDGRTHADLLDHPSVEVDALIVAGRRVAVHGVARGIYAGGLPDVGSSAREVTLGVAALLDVAADGTLTGHVVRDRLGVHRALTR
ncbi:nuclear transport factor 2 family protein [Actinomycetospora soli]|uniref:nuclear transport factor 2 family protein n=1 Tax=Actinomycetospora soli TaxID=2893887 RepID=UPI001E2EE56D|nr:nuclear transport factor 2 family protein [Actinomycetospora soli]MCD2186756.1 nuclear transport factor 2 family protein [Actinomycetospora soli]